MRVDAYNKVNQIYQTKQKSRIRETSRAEARDELCISSAGKDYQTARQALSYVPDIREDRVSELKASVDAGTWQVSADSFASKVIAKYEEMTF